MKLGDVTSLRIIERLDSRVLCALRFVDATTNCWVTQPLDVTAPGARMSRNRSGAYVVSQMAGLESYTTEFETAPTTVALGSLSLAVYITDPSGRYLPRKVQVPLPRDPDLARAANAESLFSAARVLLYPAPAAPIYPGWAIVRASVRSESTNAGVPHAWLRIRRASQPVHTNSPLGVGMADARGEALVAVTGIPVTNWSEEGETLLATEVDALIDAYADSTVESPPNPDTIETKRETLPFTCQTVKLASGRQCIARLKLTLP